MSTGHLDQLLMGIADAALAEDRRARRMVVSGLSLDSRQVQRGDAFFALSGTREHGIAFAAAAVQRGAQVILAEGPEVATESLDVPVVWVENLHAFVGEIASRFFDRPSESMRLIGVTGTNGKTSCVQLLAQALTLMGHRAASIGTLGAGLHGQLQPAERTTPDAITVHRQLAQFRDHKVTHVAMEVSSHALVQGRVAAVDFELAVFTNLSRDHLDYHGSMEAYGAAKARLFSTPDLRVAVINSDDAFGASLLAELPAGVRALRFSAAGDADAEVLASHIVTSSEGLRFHLVTPWGARDCHSPLLGRFNVANLLAVAACLGAMDEPFERIVQALQKLQPVNGRMNRLGGEHGQPLVVIDYAHTPDALEQALTALRAHCAGRLICVFGCGGERDAGKRPLMGEVAARLADASIVTDDNPRGENGDVIVQAIVAGMTDSLPMAVQRDRAAAISQAIDMAGASDVVLIAGKGHETYQEGAAGKRPFDDLALAHRLLSQTPPMPRGSRA